MAEHGAVRLGDQAKDDLTGFKGIVVGVTEWLHGCRRITIQPQALVDGKPAETSTFDEPQVTVLKPKRVPSTARTGGPRREPARRPDIAR